jgi:hypothetical protein
MTLENESDNPQPATRFRLNEFVSRTEWTRAPRIIARVLGSIDEPAIVEPGTREFHQHEAMKAAQLVSHQYTREAKKQSKRECLGHLIASLAPQQGNRP